MQTKVQVSENRARRHAPFPSVAVRRAVFLDCCLVENSGWPSVYDSNKPRIVVKLCAMDKAELERCLCHVIFLLQMSNNAPFDKPSTSWEILRLPGATTSYGPLEYDGPKSEKRAMPWAFFQRIVDWRSLFPLLIFPATARMASNAQGERSFNPS